jgi:hypothetical protein
VRLIGSGNNARQIDGRFRHVARFRSAPHQESDGCEKQNQNEASNLHSLRIDLTQCRLGKPKRRPRASGKMVFKQMAANLRQRCEARN